MRLLVLHILVFTTSALSGCQTHLSLRDNTLRTTGTLTDLNYQQVLNNVALFTAHPSSLPSIAVINAGTVTVADQTTVGGTVNYNPTLTFANQGGGALPILGLFFNPNASRNVTENWSMAPTTDIDNVHRLRCAFQLLVLNGGETSDCDHCRKLIEDFFVGEGEAGRLDCLIPVGWYGVGCKDDVPKNACYVGNYCDTFVWVTPEGIEGLARFTLTVLHLATEKEHAPKKTVEKTYTSDGKLEGTKVTTEEIDLEALETMRKEGLRLERPRVEPPSPINRGLFFAPR